MTSSRGIISHGKCATAAHGKWEFRQSIWILQWEEKWNFPCKQPAAGHYILAAEWNLKSRERKSERNLDTNLGVFRLGFQMEDVASRQTTYPRNNAPQLLPLQTHKYAACWPSWVSFWVAGYPLVRGWASSWLVSALKLSIHWKYFLQYPRASCKSSFLLAWVHLTMISCRTSTDFLVHLGTIAGLWIGKS